MASDDENSIGVEATFAGAARPRVSSDASLGDEQTLSDRLGGKDTVIDDIEVVDLETRYKIEGPLGQGGMGAVLLATDSRLDRKVAIKRILGEAAGNRMAVQRFLTEAKAIAALNHPNIVQIYDYGRAKDGPFLIMEYVDGGSLLDRCRGSALPVEEAIDLACQLCDGLAKAHDLGIIHRDIKPANVLLTKDGTPKLTDFGLAKAQAGDHGQTMTGAVLGTPDFMPPEQRSDSAAIDPRSDLWSLAATVYQMVTGRSPKVIRLKDVMPPLGSLLEKALEDDKDRRYQSAREFRDALRAAIVFRKDNAPTSDVGISEGQCPGCGTISSDLSRKFCRSCQGPLRTPCLQCDKDMAVWDPVCGECGGRQSDVAETRRQSLIEIQQQAKDAFKRCDFDKAIGLARQLASLRHGRLRKFADWGSSFANTVLEQQSLLSAQLEKKLAEAQLHAKVYDYAAAVRTIESIPVPLRDAQSVALLREYQGNRDELTELLSLIKERIQLRELDGLVPKVERAIALKGDRPDLQRLLNQLQVREAKRSQVVVGDKADAVPKPVVDLGKAQPERFPNWQARAFAAGLAALGCIALVIFVFANRGAQSDRKNAVTQIHEDSMSSSVKLAAVGDVAASGKGRLDQNESNLASGNASPSLPQVSTTSPVANNATRRRSWLGMAYEKLPEVNAQALGLGASCVIVNGVKASGPAEKASVRRGDVLLSFDGRPIAKPEDFTALGVPEMAAGSHHALTVLRDGSEVTLRIVLEERPEANDQWSPLNYSELSRTPVKGLLKEIHQAGPRVCCATDTTVSVWDVTEGNVSSSLELAAAAIDPTEEGALAVVATPRGRIATFNLASAQERLVLTDECDEELWSCRIDAAGKRIASLHGKCLLRIWDALSGKKIDEVSLTEECGKFGIGVLFTCSLGGFSPSGKLLILESGNTVFVWNVDKRTLGWSWKADQMITAFAPSPDWSSCAIGLRNGSIKIVPIKQGAVATNLLGHSGDVVSLAWHGNRWLASASHADRTARVWDIGQQKMVWQYTLEETRNNALFFGPSAVCFNKAKPGVWVGALNLRQYSLPALTEKDWIIGTLQDEAIDLGSSLQMAPLTVSSGATGRYLTGDTSAAYSFSDGSRLEGRKPPQADAWSLSFTASDGKTPLDGSLALELGEAGLITAVAEPALAKVEVCKGDMIIGMSPSEEGPFFRIPSSNKEDDQMLRWRLLAGKTGSVVWLRIKGRDGSADRTVSATRTAKADPLNIGQLRTSGILFEAESAISRGDEAQAISTVTRAIERDESLATEMLRTPYFEDLMATVMRDCRNRFDNAVSADKVGDAALAHAEAIVLDPTASWWGTFLTAQRYNRLASEGASLPAKAIGALPPVTNSIGMKFKLIPPGGYSTGARKGSRVTITKAYYVGIYEVTKGQWYESNPNGVDRTWRADDQPVGDVTWDQAVEYCRILSALPQERKAGRTYRLPTEAEWEYACRAGATTRYSFGQDEAGLVDYAWFNNNSGLRTHPVGQKKPNAWGLYDMHGNVFEWCSDWFADLEKRDVSDPNGLDEGTYKVFRGGCCSSTAWQCGAEERRNIVPSGKGFDLGIRVVFSP